MSERERERADADPRVVDVKDSLRQITLESMTQLRAGAGVPELISGSWLHGLVIGLRLAERDAPSALELLALLRASSMGPAVRQADDGVFTSRLMRAQRRSDA